MKRPDAVRLGVLIALAAAVIGTALLFHIRVRVAGLKYLLVLGAILALAWWIGRRRG